MARIPVALGLREQYCNPALGNEKGGVEGELGWYRRNWLVPLPAAGDLSALNIYLRQGCVEMLERVTSGRTVTIGAALDEERPHLQPLAADTFELEETTFPQVDGKGCVKVRTNSYSTPCSPGVRAMAKLWPSVVAIWKDGECVARHERTYGAAIRC